MIYIKKEGLNDPSLTEKIINIQKSSEWRSISGLDTGKIRSVFDNSFPKAEVKALLIREQKGLCAYCMRRIRYDSHSRLEHMIPLSKDKDKALEYDNLLAVCDGGEREGHRENRILCCDAHKGETEISLSPLNKFQMEKIAYNSDGIIFTAPRDEEMEKDINETLQLNGIIRKNGTVQDTSTELVKGRRDAYKNARRLMKAMDDCGKGTSASVKKYIDKILNEREYKEYIGVELFYFNKKYKSLLKRGM